MHERRLYRKVIGEHFASLRKRRRETIADLSCGLMHARRVRLAAIARAMRAATTGCHRIKRPWRFAKKEGTRVSQVSRAVCEWILSGSAAATVALDWTHLGGYQMLAAKVAVAGRAVRAEPVSSRPARGPGPSLPPGTASTVQALCRIPPRRTGFYQLLSACLLWLG